MLRLLGVEDMFEGLTYCDYAAERIICKPFPAMYEKAMREAGVEDVRDCYFVGAVKEKNEKRNKIFSKTQPQNPNLFD